jgi:hypothetical protein
MATERGGVVLQKPARHPHQSQYFYNYPPPSIATVGPCASFCFSLTRAVAPSMDTRGQRQLIYPAARALPPVAGRCAGAARCSEGPRQGNGRRNTMRSCGFPRSRASGISRSAGPRRRSRAARRQRRSTTGRTRYARETEG